MTVLDDQWARVYPALQQIKSDYMSPPTDPWSDRREVILGQLRSLDPAQDLVEVLIKWLDELPVDDRTALLAKEELDTQAYTFVAEYAAKYDPPPGAEPAYEDADPAPQAADDTAQDDTAQDDTAQDDTAQDDTAYDETAWDQYLATNGPTWDGSAESWPQFREWFSYHAAKEQLTAPATGFLELLDSQTPEGRIATFAQYQVTIQPPAAQPPAQPPAEPLAAEPAPVADGAAATLMASLVAEDPEFAEIPEQRRLEILDEVLSEEEPDEEQASEVS